MAIPCKRPTTQQRALRCGQNVRVIHGQPLRWLRQALRNLDEEAEFLARENTAAAMDMVGTMQASVALLSRQPGIGRPGRLPGTRELVIQRYPYLLPYRVRGGVLEVLRVFHTSRQPPTKW